MPAHYVNLALCDAWYSDYQDEGSILVWTAPADGEWAVYLVGLVALRPLGEPDRYVGLPSREAARSLAESLLPT